MGAKLRALILAAVTVISGCDPSPPLDPALMSLPILDPTGTTTSREFVRLFAQNCVPGFPDRQAMAAAFLDDGFTESGRFRGSDARNSYWDLARDSDDLSATIGIGYHLELIFFRDTVHASLGCSLAGDVSDPANFEAAVLAMIDADGEPFDWRERRGRYRMFLERQGITAELVARLPTLYPLRQNPMTLCGGLPACRAWSSTGMSISVPIEVPSR